MTDACPCGRKACDDPAPVCVLCPVLTNRRPRHVEEPHGCGDCRVKLAALPGDIADAYTYLDEILEPRRGGAAIGAPKADEAPIPLAVDPYDLTASHTLPQGPIRLARLAANLRDQIGEMPVATQLGWWVVDWAVVRDQGEAQNINGWGVSVLAGWLEARSDWAASHHAAVDQYATELHTLRGVLHRHVGRPEPDERPQRLTGVPCPRCRHVTLIRHHDGDTECQHPDCATLWRPDDWTRVTRAVAGALRKQPATIA